MVTVSGQSRFLDFLKDNCTNNLACECEGVSISYVIIPVSGHLSLQYKYSRHLISININVISRYRTRNKTSPNLYLSLHINIYLNDFSSLIFALLWSGSRDKF